MVFIAILLQLILEMLFFNTKIASLSSKLGVKDFALRFDVVTFSFTILEKRSSTQYVMLNSNDVLLNML